MTYIKRIDEMARAINEDVDIAWSMSASDNTELMDYTLFFTAYGGDEISKRNFINLVRDVYGDSSSRYPINLKYRGGNPEYESSATWNDRMLYTIVKFERRRDYCTLSKEALEELGDYESNFYGIMIDRESRELYLASFSETDGWNRRYRVCRCMKLEDVNFPILSKVEKYYIDGAILSEMKRHAYKGKPMYGKTNNGVWVMIRNNGGQYERLEGSSLDDVFREYADHYTGYKSYKRTYAVDWDICDNDLKKEYDKWAKTATGLKSDFDKFYGNGVVD